MRLDNQTALITRAASGMAAAQTRRHPAGPPPNPRGHRQSVLVPGVRRCFDDYQGEPEGGRRRWHL